MIMRRRIKCVTLRGREGSDGIRENIGNGRHDIESEAHDIEIEASQVGLASQLDNG